MKIRRFLIIFLCLSLLFISSCEMPTVDNNEQDSSLDGLDIDKLEKPQTEFMYDGHTLSKYEEIAKMIIVNGTFVYDTTLQAALGYKYVLKSGADYQIYALYSVDNIKIFVTSNQSIKNRGRNQYLNVLQFIRISRENTTIDENEMTKMGFLVSNRYGELYYGIYSSLMKNFDSNAVGTWELAKGDISPDLDAFAMQTVARISEALELLNIETKKNIKISLSEVGYLKYN